MKVLICGSRKGIVSSAILNRIRELPPDTIVITGGAVGVDRIAEWEARAAGLHVAVVQPLWERHGKNAGLIRNAAMLDLAPDLVIAFSTGTKGTQNTIDQARKRGIPVEVIGREA